MKTESKLDVFGPGETGGYIISLSAAHDHSMHVEKTIENLLHERLYCHTWHRLMSVPEITWHSFCLKFLRTKFLSLSRVMFRRVRQICREPARG